MRRSTWCSTSALLALALLPAAGAAPMPWSAAERAQIAALSLSRLPAPPADPGNRHADDARAAALGRALFHDPRLSRNGELSCASCHQSQRQFTDGLPQSRGLQALRRNAPSLLTAAWQPWQFWDGRADSLWMQALVPLLSDNELGLSPRTLRQVVDAAYRVPYEAVFGPMAAHADGRVLANVGKAIAAFERTLRPRAAPFDAFADAAGRGEPSDAIGADAQAGLRLFLGKGQCLRCHHGPLLSNQAFHNTGLDKLRGLPTDLGRAAAIEPLLASEFNCRGPWSDDPARACPRLDYLRVGPELRGAFKVPSLRDVAATAPYMHDGRFATLAEVLAHYNKAPTARESGGHSELFPLGLSARELASLEAFLQTLSPQDKAGH